MLDIINIITIIQYELFAANSFKPYWQWALFGPEGSREMVAPPDFDLPDYIEQDAAAAMADGFTVRCKSWQPFSWQPLQLAAHAFFIVSYYGTMPMYETPSHTLFVVLDVSGKWTT
jgi:hypothetical protein